MAKNKETNNEQSKFDGYATTEGAPTYEEFYFGGENSSDASSEASKGTSASTIEDQESLVASEDEPLGLFDNTYEETEEGEETDKAGDTSESEKIVIDGKEYTLDEIKAWKTDSDNKTNWQKSNTQKAQQLAQKAEELKLIESKINELFKDEPGKRDALLQIARADKPITDFSVFNKPIPDSLLKDESLSPQEKRMASVITALSEEIRTLKSAIQESKIEDELRQHLTDAGIKRSDFDEWLKKGNAGRFTSIKDYVMGFSHENPDKISREGETARYLSQLGVIPIKPTKKLTQKEIDKMSTLDVFRAIKSGQLTIKT